MTSRREPVWIGEDAVTALNARLVAMFGGVSGGVRDENLLKAALGRPLDKWPYDDPGPDIFALAAAYCFALVKGHVFHDGNKPTAYVAAVVFLALNGFTCAPAPAHIVHTMRGAAAGTVSEADLAEWFEINGTVRGQAQP